VFSNPNYLRTRNCKITILRNISKISPRESPRRRVFVANRTLQHKNQIYLTFYVSPAAGQLSIETTLSDLISMTLLSEIEYPYQSDKWE
jgi:hypothetical protein